MPMHRDGVCCIVPFFDGHVIPHAIMRPHLAGRDVTNRLAELLTGERLLACFFLLDTLRMAFV